MTTGSAHITTTRRARRRLCAGLLAATACLLLTAPAALAAPTVTIGGVPPSNDIYGTFTFAADGPALRLECSLDGSAFGLCTSPLNVGPLAVVPHTFGVRAIGLDNSVGSPPRTYSWTIDLTPPEPPVVLGPPDGTFTNIDRPIFSGIAEPGVRVIVYDGEVRLGSTLADGGGQWFFTSPVSLSDGPHQWRVRAEDAAGNRSEYTPNPAAAQPYYVLNVDTQPPAAPVWLKPSSGAWINSATPSFSGTAEALATVTVRDGATPLCSAVANSAGDWACASSIALADGTTTLSATSTDLAGNSGPSSSRSFDLDSTPPLITAPVDGLATTASSITVSGQGRPLTTIKVSFGLLGPISVMSAGDGSWSHGFSSLAEGDYALTARYVDGDGNLGTPSNTVNVRIDRTPPVVSFATHPRQPSNQTSDSFTLAADEPNVDFECDLDASGWQPCPAAYGVSGLASGTHTLDVRGTDRAGNAGGVTSFSWTIDLVPPAPATINQPAENALTNDPHKAFSGLADPGSTVTLFEGAAALGSGVAGGSGGWTASPSAALPDGPHTIVAVASDAAENSAPASAARHIVVDTITPVTTLTAVPPALTNSTSVSVSFTRNDPAASTYCSIDNTAFTPCSSPKSTGYMSEGVHNLRLRSVDLAGNVEPAKVVTVDFDRTAPLGESVLIDGSNDSHGVPAFSVASNDPTASAKCKVDNGAFVNCSGTFRPSGISPGLHALTIRFTDLAGNQGDQVTAFAVTPPAQPQPPAGNYYEEPPVGSRCIVLGKAGSGSGRLSIRSLRTRKRVLTVRVTATAAGVIRADLTAGRRSFAGGEAAVRRGSNSLRLRLKRTPTRGTALELALRYYGTTRNYTTARLALTAGSAGSVRKRSGAQTVLDGACPARRGAAVKLSVRAGRSRVGARTLQLATRARRPALVGFVVRTSADKRVVAESILAVAAGRQKLNLRLAGKLRLARGSYRVSYVTFSTGGAPGRGTARVRVR